MCILFIAIKQHPDFPLIIAANRDEFHQRPTLVSSFWPNNSNILAGTDLQAGGTWMGINRNGRLSALTNVRDPQRIDPQAKTRGELVTQYLANEYNNVEYLHALKRSQVEYNGYNLLFGDWRNLWVYNNHQDQVEHLSAGFHGLSNASLNSPWPKIDKGVRNLEHYCTASDNLDSDALFELLLDDTQAEDQYLPQTGVPIEWERKLSSIFIQSEEYGTRSSTVLLIDNNQGVTWKERTFDAEAKITEQKNFQFVLS